MSRVRSFRLTAVAAGLGVSSAFAAPGDALGPQFNANDAVEGSRFAPAVARAPDGRFVVVWGERSIDQSTMRLHVRRYFADGSPAGIAFLVDDSLSGTPIAPSVAMDADGDFTVAWTDGLAGGVRARRFDAAGHALGPIQTATSAANASHPSVAMEDDGDFVVAWQQSKTTSITPFFACYFGYLPCTSAQGSSIRARRYTSGGTFAEAVKTVGTASATISSPSTTSGSTARLPAVTTTPDGGFAVVWERGGNGTFSETWLRRYAATGSAGSAVRVSKHVGTNLELSNPDVGSDASGNLVVTWQKRIGDDSYRPGIFARRYDERTRPVGNEFRVDADSDTALAEQPSIAVSPDGQFTIAWHNIAPDQTAKARMFDPAGAPITPPFPLASEAGNTLAPQIASDSEGNFVATWLHATGAILSGNIAVRLFDGP